MNGIESQVYEIYGFNAEYAELSAAAPVKSVREEIKGFMSPDMRVSAGVARVIFEACESVAIARDGDTIAVDPNDFMTIVMINVDY